jgi:hypothetical protein
MRHVKREPFLEADGNLAEALRELNELRRSRALPEYQPRSIDLRAFPRAPSRRRLSVRLRVDL